MIEKFLHEEYPGVLDLTKPNLKSDSPELLEIAKELKTRTDIIKLWANFETKAYGKSPLSRIYELIDRNYKRFMINELALNNPQYRVVDLSYVPTNITAQPGQTLGQPYKLTSEDFKALIAALKKNKHLVALKINYLPAISLTQYLQLAETLAKTNIIALYCCDNSLSKEENEEFIKRLANHKTLIQLTMFPDGAVYYSANAEQQTKKISQCQSIEELKQCISELKYIPSQDYFYSSGEIIQILENNKKTKILKILASLTTYNLLSTIDRLLVTKTDSSALILGKLIEIPENFVIGKTAESFFEKLVSKCETLEQLQKLLKKLKSDIQGKNDTHSPEKILKAIELIMADQAKFTRIPHYGGLRKKVMELKAKMELVPETPPLASMEIETANEQQPANNEIPFDNSISNEDKNIDDEEQLKNKRRRPNPF